MNSKSSWSFLLLITLLHIGGIAFVVSATESTEPTIIEPTIQGVLITPEKKEVIPAPPEPPKPKRKHKHKKKKKHIPKAPPSERAVKEPEPEPVPIEPEPVETPEPEPQPAPVVPPSDAQEVNNPAPAYPAISRKLKEEGIVSLRILVKKEGHVEEIEIKKSSGYKRLDDAAARAIKRWKFNPATQAGEPIDYWYEIDFEFSLRKK